MSPSINNLSLSDCCEIIKKKLKTSDFKVNSFKICPLDERKGFLGDYYYLLINYSYGNKEADERLFIKKKSTSGVQEDFLNENKMFSKECQFYEKLVSDILDSGIHILSDCVPECYFVSDDQYLIFENLAIQKYINLNPRACSRLDYVRSNLDALAKLHCSGLIFEEKMKGKYGKNFRFPQNYAEVFAESFFPRTNISKRFIEAAKEETGTIIDLTFQNTNVDVERFKKVTTDVYDTFFDVVEPSTSYRNTICHCDLWATNFMCKFEDDKAVHSYLIDFQMLRYGPPGQDFMTYLYLTTSKKFRQDHIKDLMEYYYKKVSELLEEHGFRPTDILSFEEFIESCNYYKTFICLLTVNHHQMTMFAEEIMGELLENGFMQKMLFEGRPQVINEYWNRDDFYREKMIENITEFRDTLIDNKQL